MQPRRITCFNDHSGDIGEAVAEVVGIAPDSYWVLIDEAVHINVVVAVSHPVEISFGLIEGAAPEEVVQVCCIAGLVAAVFRRELGIEDLKIAVNSVSVTFKNIAACIGECCHISALVGEEIINCGSVV